jgi:hypothetical protein
MKRFSLYPLSSYKNKYVGLSVVLFSILLLLVLNGTGPLPLLKKYYDADRQFDMIAVLGSFGLFLMAWTKEKKDDERVRIIRHNCFRIAFGITMVNMLTFSMCCALVKKPMVLDVSILYLFIDISLIAYLILFNVGLYFDPQWNYNDDTDAENIKNNKGLVIVYLIAIILLVVAIIMHKFL